MQINQINSMTNCRQNNQKANVNFKGGFQLLGEKANKAYDEFVPMVNELSSGAKIQAKKVTDYLIPRFHVTCESKLDKATFNNLYDLANKHGLELESNNIDYYKAIPNFDLEKSVNFNSNWNQYHGLGPISKDIF